MKTLLKNIIATAFLMGSVNAYAHANHEEVRLTQEVASYRGDIVIDALVSDKKISTSWQKKQRKGVESRATPAGIIWIVSYENGEEKDKAKRTIYLFLDEVGNYIGANYTGKL